MRPPMAEQPPRVPVKVIRAEMMIQCPGCLSGVGFLTADPIPPGQGVHVKCPSCGTLLGFQPFFVRLDAPKRLIL